MAESDKQQPTDRLAQASLGSHSLATQAPSPRPRAGARLYNGSGDQGSSRPAQAGRTCPSPPPVPSHISGVHIAWNDTERALAAWTDTAPAETARRATAWRATAHGFAHTEVPQQIVQRRDRHVGFSGSIISYSRQPGFRGWT